MEERVRSSLLVALVALFGALHAALVALPGIWRSWVIAILPLEGVLLGPRAGFLAALMGCLLGRLIRPRPGLYIIFGLAEPVGALAAGLTIRGRWKALLALYVALLAAYFAHPLGRSLPAWCLWDTYIALALSPVGPRLAKRALDARDDPRVLAMSMAFTALLSVEADVLFRIFLLVPAGLYVLMGVSEATLRLWWLAGALETPIESAISVLIAVAMGVPVLASLERGRVLKWPLT